MPGLPIIVIGFVIYALLSMGLNRLGAKAAAAGDRTNPRWQIQERAVICVLTCFLVLLVAARQRPLVGSSVLLDLPWFLSRTGTLLGFLLLFHISELISEEQRGDAVGMAKRRFMLSLRIISPVWFAVAFFILVTRGNVLLGWILDISLLLSFCAGVLAPAIIRMESPDGDQGINRETSRERRNAWLMLIAGILPLSLLSIEGFQGVQYILSLSGIMFCLVSLSTFSSLSPGERIPPHMLREDVLFFTFWLTEFLLLSSRLVPVRISYFLPAAGVILLILAVALVNLLGRQSGLTYGESWRSLLRRSYGVAAVPLFFSLLLLSCPLFLEPGRVPTILVLLAPSLAILAGVVRVPELLPAYDHRSEHHTGD
jgi:hypothetical protein